MEIPAQEITTPNTGACLPTWLVVKLPARTRNCEKRSGRRVTGGNYSKAMPSLALGVACVASNGTIDQALAGGPFPGMD
ncbi:unnamed protein product [Clonostachys byssicola]|uniref:Uncharacterized protein n=1 Tax=Clonostachys byssicola TaxID=160290 RepID=A0A9N9UP63_9HYPO|nr:unnamed protein product [Clonostachys byssicola]